MFAMISVVIPTLNAERHLAACLTALVPSAVEGVVREVIIVDGGSTDRTTRIVDQAGAVLLTTEPGRGRQLLAGARRARQPWLLFLHADTVLATDWGLEAVAFMGRVDTGNAPLGAATFRFALDDRGMLPRVVESLVALRRSLFALPYGDQGLLIPRRLYDEIGGYKDVALMEDVDIVRRLGRRRLTALHTPATTSAERYRQEGYVRRIFRNQASLALYACGASPAMIARVYAGPQSHAADARAAAKGGGRISTM